MNFRDRLKVLQARVAARPCGLQIRAAAETAEILLYDEIGFWGITAADFARELAAVKAPRILLRINSPGGDVFDGLAIYNSLLQHAQSHNATIETQIDGLAASAASFVALAGSRVTMAKNAFYMIHNAWGLVIGNKADMRSMADLLQQVDDQIAAIYAARAAKTAAEIAALMDDETWFNAEAAKEAGFVDEILDLAGGKAAAKAQVPEGLFAHTPAEILAPKESPAPQPVEQPAPPVNVAALRRRLRLVEAE